MNLILRIAVQLLAAFFLFLLCIQVIVIAAAWLFWPELLRSGTAASSQELFFMVLCAVLFLLTLLLIGWYLGKPIYYMMIWIRRLANGQYNDPARWDEIHTRRNHSLKFPYAVYKELFEHLRKLASTLKANEEALRQSEQTKREWIRGISHDLKTPLTYISGYSNMLINKEYGWSEAERLEFLTIIQQKADHLQELVQDLNETVHGQIPLRTERVDLVEIVRRTAADVGSAPWASGYLLRLDSESDLIMADCDPRLIMRAIRNLLVNAVVHNPEGTMITVRIMQRPDRTAEIRIEDNGIGFNDSVDRPGLGLSIAKQLVEAHGGKMNVHSKPNEGTSLSIRLQAEHI
ncbi:sensor histidine kinase [Paenibacillus harenae]|uniref:sensor histidine kinase n=1 Tax=Paenibacillus harenae TaxID=306543 RepID=UPI0027916F90|nr:HAMP domain-containing sensor histidine kinase [Paenibacillus harenae]MDQ0058765.1 signal transduction histidine kinase [Paenibacillus harenae]